MRKRYLRPGFFENEELAELPAATRLLFAGLWLVADRKGRLRDRPARIKGELFPYDATNVDRGLKQLAEAQFIKRYEVDGQRLIWIPTFLLHQSPHPHEPASTLPRHPDDPSSDDVITSPDNAGPSPRGNGNENEDGNENLNEDEDEEGAPGAPPPGPEPPRGSEIAKDWAEVQAAYEATIGPLLPADQQRLGAYCRQMPKDWVLAAIAETGGARDPGWPYLDKILGRCVTTSKPPSGSKKAPAAGSARAAILDRYQQSLASAAPR